MSSPLFVGSPCYPLNATHLGKLHEQNVKRSWVVIPFEVFCVLLGFVGIIGNSFVICIYRRKTNKSSATYFILTLAAIDLYVCLTVVPFSLVQEAFLKYSWAEETACKIFEWFRHSSLSISCLTLAGIAIDRYIVICHPLSVLVSHGRARAMIVVSFILGAGFQVQVLVFFGVRTTRVIQEDLLGCRCDFKDEYYRTTRHIYFISSLFTGYILLLIIIVVCYVLVWLTVRKRHIDRQKQQLGSFIHNKPVTGEAAGGSDGASAKGWCWCCCLRKRIIPETVPDATKWAIPKATQGSSSSSQGESQQRVGTGDSCMNNNSARLSPIQGKHANNDDNGIGNDKHLTISGGSLAKVVWEDIIEDDNRESHNDGARGKDTPLRKRFSTERLAEDLDDSPRLPREDRKSPRISLVVPDLHGMPNQILDSYKEAKGIRTKRVSFESNSSGKLSLGHISNDLSSGSDCPGDEGGKQIRQLLNRMESVHSVDFRNNFLPRVQEMDSADREINAHAASKIEEETLESLQCSLIMCCCINRNASARNSNPEVHLGESTGKSENTLRFRLCCGSNSQSKVLHMSESMHATLSSFQQARYKTARLLLIVTVIFLLSWLPFWVVLIYSYVDLNLWVKASPVKLNLLLIGRHFYFINSMANPFIYAFMNRRFRDDLRKICGPSFRRLKKFCCCKKQAG